MVKENKKEEKQYLGEDKKEHSEYSEHSQHSRQSAQNNKKEFFSMLEDKIFGLGKKILKNGIANIAMSQINNTEEKIKRELEAKYKEYRSKALKIALLTIGIIFFVYGAVSLLFLKLGFSEWVNIAFGTMFLTGYLLLKLLKIKN